MGGKLRWFTLQRVSSVTDGMIITRIGEFNIYYNGTVSDYYVYMDAANRLRKMHNEGYQIIKYNIDGIDVSLYYLEGFGVIRVNGIEYIIRY